MKINDYIILLLYEHMVEVKMAAFNLFSNVVEKKIEATC